MLGAPATGTAANLFFGNEVSFAGDVSGDGVDDIIVGATGHKNASNQLVGQAQLGWGGSTTFTMSHSQDGQVGNTMGVHVD